MNTLTISLLAGLVALLLGHGGRATAQTNAPLDAFTLNQQLGRGVNILGYDPVWRSREQGRFKTEYFQMLKTAGFDSVRINLHPFRSMVATNDWTLRPAWLKTLDW